MDTKLALSLDKLIIEKAKKYAKSNKKSLSKIIENYLASLVKKEAVDIEISSFVKSIATGNSVPLNIDSKEDSIGYLNKKYQ